MAEGIADENAWRCVGVLADAITNRLDCIVRMIEAAGLDPDALRRPAETAA